ncbi:SAC3/GANP/Nin1/mts3/eIF-3 p25 family-domain-containing protein [Microdochium trichocladiopsis]|uniref:SAC3/GANP/Nin1/mts3/eIF-3 p25 family-domain-containing protein n=1 Tax=Microdochium trichocladiopsis TaxID=1682393 RepID=A0A9P8YBQ1_9PEZI|nr:SAC3/GANP/Nin1/mts3/eIF-3 p25 family-domain-containing protein [Microdochium trichocladiopsis]KAH7033389.1 SAC3/GANP/Nin1/mts3/eIF-3 p25 family-domain-containing protein [Microdochium trichocladiopsis]
MCPDWERITRIIQHDVKREEREEINGESQANIELMVTRHARSSAGQDAPLPMDVRSPGALRRTLNYMIDELIPEDHLLPARHNFLWDRTRAIRKDFIYQEYAMGHDEMKDYIYCLETIARFHVTALHLLTQPDFAGKDFSAQQENEQLEKTLISLMQAYDDCAKQGIECEHEADFRSYYIIVMADNPAWMDVVQSFAARFWNDSDSIRTASILVESLKNVWDMQGPLMPPGTSEMALPIISAFFDIVSSPAISYTMACFAEIHFPKVRRLMLKILREAYWRPKTGPTDLTPAVIQRQLRLDSEEEAIEFAKSQGFTFGFANGHMYAVNNARQALSEDKPPRMFSKSLVERKRGNHTLAEVIYTTFYEEPASTKQASAKNDSLFVDDSSDVQLGTDSPVLKPFDATTSGSGARSPFALPSPAAQEVPPNSTTSSRPSMFPTPHSQAVPTSEKQNFFSTLPPPNTDQASNKTTFASTAGFAEASVKPAVKSFMPNIASASPATASSNLPSGKTITVEAEKSNQAPAPPKPGGFNFSSAQNPPSSTSPSIFDKPTSSALPGAASSATTGFVFPGSGPAESLKPTPLFPTTSEPKPNAPSFVFPPPSTTAPKSAPFTAGRSISFEACLVLGQRYCDSFGSTLSIRCKI